MAYKVSLVKNKDNTFDLVINFPRFDLLSYKEEISKEFFTRFRKDEASPFNITESLKEYVNKVVVRSIVILAGGSLVAIISLSDLTLTYAADVSLAYLYEGTAAKQIEYVSETKDALNTVAPNYFDINAQGVLTENNVSPKLIAAMKEKGIKVTPFVSNHWDRAAGIAFLKNYESNAKKLVQYVKDYKLDGLNIDIENVTEAERDFYTKFVKSLSEKMPTGSVLSVAVSANPKGWSVGWHGSYDYRSLAEYCDYLMIMAYDEHYQNSPAGPVASIDWVEDSIKYALKQVSSDKIVLGIPLFGRVWSSDNAFQGKGVDLKFADTLMKAYGGTVEYDSQYESPKGIFKVKSGDPVYLLYGQTLKPGTYTIWYENDKSIKKKINLVEKYDLRGAGTWALGKELTSIWNNYSDWLKLEAGQPVTVKGTNPSQTTGTSQTTGKTKTVTTSKGTTSSQATTWGGTVTASTLNVRSKASVLSKKIGTLKKNKKVTIVKKGKTWHTIKLSSGKQGYVSAKYIKLS